MYTTDIRKLLIPFVYYKRKLKRKKSFSEFDSPNWSSFLYKEILDKPAHIAHELLNEDATISYLNKYSSKDYNKSFNQLLSVANWIKQ